MRGQLPTEVEVELHQVVTDFFLVKDPDTMPGVDPVALLRVIHQLPGAPGGSEGLGGLPRGDLLAARAVGALLYLAVDDELTRRIAEY